MDTAATGLGNLSEAIWVSIGSIAAGLAFIANAWLAWETRDLANETKALAEETKALAVAAKDEREQNERHHQESLMPWLSGGATFNRSQIRPNELRVRAEISVRNFGLGPCKTVVAYIKPQALVQRACGIPPLSIGQELKGHADWSSSNMTAQGFAMIPYELLLRYATVFDTEGLIRITDTSGVNENNRVEQVFTPGQVDAKKIDDYISDNGFKPAPP